VTRWMVYVDESGDFKRADGEVAVAAVAFADQAGDEVAESMRRCTVALGLDIPWPIHAAHVNLPVYLAITSHLAAESAGANSPRTPLQGKARRALLALQDSLELPRVLETLADQKVPKIADVRSLEDRLRRGDREIHRTFRHKVAELRGRLQAIARDADNSSAFGFILAGEALDPAQRTAMTEARRYDNLLLAAIRRLRDAAPEAEICLHVASRPTAAGWLTPDYLRRLLGSIRNVRIVGVWSYNAQMPPPSPLSSAIRQ